MLKTTIVGMCLFITISFLQANAVTTDEIPGYIPPRPPKIVSKGSESYKTMIDHYAKKYSEDWQNLASDMTFIIKCESHFNRYAVNPNGEYSVGLSQINLDVHTNITKEQAEDPDFAIDFMAKHLSQGRYNMWFHCSNKLSTIKNQ